MRGRRFPGRPARGLKLTVQMLENGNVPPPFPKSYPSYPSYPSCSSCHPVSPLSCPTPENFKLGS